MRLKLLWGTDRSEGASSILYSGKGMMSERIYGCLKLSWEMLRSSLMLTGLHKGFSEDFMGGPQRPGTMVL